jgi:predicted metal-dependent hydrolase
VEWSTHPIKGWYGKAIYEHHTTPGNGRILINTLLDSPAVSQATIKFLLWHEYLHLLLKTGHPPEFRRREKAFPGYIEADRELDNLQNRFNFRWY